MNKKYIDGLVNKLLKETIEEKADNLVSKLKTNMNEMGSMDNKDQENVNFSTMSNKEIEEKLDELLTNYDKDDWEEIGGEMEEGFDEYDFELNEGDGEVCECGGNLYEGECMECGKSYMGEEAFDYVQEEDESSDLSTSDPDYNKDTCQYHMKNFGPEDPITQEFCKGGEMKEEFKGRQRRLDKNKNNKIYTEDFEILRKEKKSVKESKKSTFTLTENQLVDLIEKIILEQKTLKGTGEGEAKGLTKYREIHKKDGKNAEEYLDSVAKKMKEYIKDGSKGEYNVSPKHHPKGNGQLEKMSTKKYTMSEDGQEFINDFMRPGIELTEFDEIQANEDWMKKNIEGSEMTGNSPKYANAEETELGKKINKKRKENKLAKAKKMAYKKAPQPITDKVGEEAGGGINIKLENEKPKTEKKLNEEFNKIANLINYNRKTQ